MLNFIFYLSAHCKQLDLLTISMFKWNGKTTERVRQKWKMKCMKWENDINTRHTRQTHTPTRWEKQRWQRQKENVPERTRGRQRHNFRVCNKSFSIFIHCQIFRWVTASESAAAVENYTELPFVVWLQASEWVIDAVHTNNINKECNTISRVQWEQQ